MKKYDYKRKWYRTRCEKAIKIKRAQEAVIEYIQLWYKKGKSIYSEYANITEYSVKDFIEYLDDMWWVSYLEDENLATFWWRLADKLDIVQPKQNRPIESEEEAM